MIKKIKLRDLTPEQWDKNRHSLCKLLSHACCENCIFQWVGGCSDSICRNSWINHKDFYSDKFLDQEVKIDVPDILNKDEKEYLSNLIKPFRDKILYISKILSGDNNFISINFGNKHSYIFPIEEEDIYKYCGMKYYQQYTLEELGL